MTRSGMPERGNIASNRNHTGKTPVDSFLPEATTHIATCPVLKLLAKRPSMTSIEDKLL
jgi:hypothetical protein